MSIKLHYGAGTKTIGTKQGKNMVVHELTSMKMSEQATILNKFKKFRKRNYKGYIK